MPKVHIVIVEWMGYPLFRKKKLRENIVRCGLGRLLKKMQIKTPGVDFSCSIIVNRSDDSKSSGILKYFSKLPFFRYLLRNVPETNDEEKFKRLAAKYSFVDEILFRDNVGQDIGAYNYAYTRLREQGFSEDVVFMNSSLSGPDNNDWLKVYQDLFYLETDTGLCGITLNSNHIDSSGDVHFSPHIQSFFLYSSMNILSKVFPEGLVDEEVWNTKHDIIEHGEVGISTRILDAGFGVRCRAFPEFYYKKNASWEIPIGDMRYVKENRAIANVI